MGEPVQNFDQLDDTQKIAFLMNRVNSMDLLFQQRQAEQNVIYKQQIEAREALRKNAIRIEKDKLKKNPGNVRMMEMVMKTLYSLEDLIESWNGIVPDPLGIKDPVDAAVKVNVEGRNPEVVRALFSTISSVKDIKSMMENQKTLIEAASSSPYGWNAAVHMEEEKGIFSQNDKDNVAKLRTCEGYVRRDRKEFKTRNKSNVPYKKYGSGQFKSPHKVSPWLNSNPRRTFGDYPQASVYPQPSASTTSSVGYGGQSKMNTVKQGCYKCGDLGHMFAKCPVK